MMRFDVHDVPTEGLAESETIRGAYDCFVKQGYAILDNALPGDRMREVAAEFERRYAHYYNGTPAGEFMEVGNRRMMIPVELSGVFNDPLLFANPYVLAMLKMALGPDAVIEAFGAFVALPGAEKQHVHRDGPSLFDAGIARILPAHALTVVFPLIEMNDRHGSTRIWPGSHRHLENDPEGPNEAPVVPLGSCFMWDFRTYHSGTANVSDRQRPMLYAVYSRPWFKDSENYGRGVQRRLALEPGLKESLPKETKALFANV
ncbi:MAG: phytanoyl-CoA dioxygenase family protein [Proteobacteria bacterium]|nr:phytanoyl-CoA dioxygenase family protein [Pseudomonadota bacterium]